VTPADEEYVKRLRAKIAAYPRLAREALWRRENDEAEHWRLWHEAIHELFKHLRAGR
jgi:hypothetical protein